MSIIQFANSNMINEPIFECWNCGGATYGYLGKDGLFNEIIIQCGGCDHILSKDNTKEIIDNLYEKVFWESIQ